MKPWDIYTWEFPEVEDHPAVILGTEARLASKPKSTSCFAPANAPHDNLWNLKPSWMKQTDWTGLRFASAIWFLPSPRNNSPANAEP